MNVRLASPANLAAARRDSAQKLADAEEICGRTPLLQLEQRDYQTDQKTSDDRSSDVRAAIASLPASADAWEHCGFGRWLMHHGAYAEAEQQFIAAIDEQPSEFWAHFQLLRCHFELQQFEAALRSAEVCVALEPEQAECFYNRGLCQRKLGHRQESLVDFDRALKLDADFAPARLERGILLGEQRKYAEAERDLNSALQHGSKPSEIYYELARLSFDQGDRANAKQRIEQSLAADPTNAPAIALKKRL